jgi:hypothetical protein
MATNSTPTYNAALLAFPEHVHEGETLKLVTRLFDPNTEEEVSADFYRQHRYVYTAFLNNKSVSKLTEDLNAGSKGIDNESVIESLPHFGPGVYDITVVVSTKPQRGAQAVQIATASVQIHIGAAVADTKASVQLQRTFAQPTDDMAMGPAIRNRTAAVGFDRYAKFIDCVFCEDTGKLSGDIKKLLGQGDGLVQDCVDHDRFNPIKFKLDIHGPHAYSVLKFATQAFLTLESGVVIREGDVGRPKIFDIDKERARFSDQTLDVATLKNRLANYLIGPSSGQDGVLPYLDRIVTALVGLEAKDRVETLPYCHGILQHRLTSPSLIELIWSYWLEEGMLVQTMNAIARRFQNQRGSRNDPLGELEFDPLRPLNNLIWGFIQDEHNRLTVTRRDAEYKHQYGLGLIGKAVDRVAPADVRSKFIEAFHNLLYRTAVFYREDSDTTVIADAFPLLNALKEVHLILAEGAHNQFGDLTWTARAEMLMTQWMLARPEMREFLRGRYMVPYQERWMGAVDSMKKLQGWTDTSVTHFHELAVTGERILLSIRYGDWVDIENIEDQAKNWARSWKPEIQRYLHAYMTVSGVDLMADVTDSRDAAIRYLPPALLLQRRLGQQQAATSGPAPRRLVASTVQRVSGVTELAPRQRVKLLDLRKQD